MKKIDTTYWKEFQIDDIFEVIKGRRLKKSDHIEGSINYIGATIFNNGITDKVGNNTHIHPSGTITVCYNCSDIGTAFYQDDPFWATDDVNVLYPKFKISKYIAHFICPIIHRLGMAYTYENKWTAEKMRVTKISLPSAVDGSPDWQYMEDYMRRIEQKTKSAITALKKAKNACLKIDHFYWKEFKIGEIFIISRPNARLAIEREVGDVPFVASGNVNNGIEKYVDAKDEVLDNKGCITVSPVDGSSFYQPNDFLGRGGAGSSIIILRNDKLKPYSALYICSILKKQCSKYSYSNMGSASKLRNELILLPATPSGEPDWHYMEMYMRGVEAIVKSKLSLLIPHKPEITIKEAETINFANASVTYIDNSTNYNIKK